MPALAHALLAALKDHGAREIFGIPGDFVLPLFKVCLLYTSPSPRD